MKENFPADEPKKLRPGNKKENMLYGRQPVLEAIKAHRPIKEIWVTDNMRGELLKNIRHDAAQNGINIKSVPKTKMPREFNHQGIVAIVESYSYWTFEEMLEKADKEMPFLVVLDHLEDPHNFGAVLRTAEAVGVDGVIIPDRRSVAITPAVAKAAAGASELVPVAQVANIANCIKALKEKGYWIFAMDPSAGQDVWQVDLKLPCAVVLGNEGKGISRLVLESCDFLVKLPMQGQVSSLNVSVAGAVFMYEVLRQRLNP